VLANLLKHLFSSVLPFLLIRLSLFSRHYSLVIPRAEGEEEFLQFGSALGNASWHHPSLPRTAASQPRRQDLLNLRQLVQTVELDQLPQ